MKYGQPFVVDASALTRARASRVLAVRPEIIGSMLSLPLELRAPEKRLVAEESPDGGEAPTANEVDEGSKVAVVSIDGPLSQRGEQHLCGMVDGYDWITMRVTSALADPEVGAVVLRVNSPGGDVAGLEEGVRRMRAAAERAGKRVIAFADELAASAAYWISAGVADEVLLPPGGEVGSIGTIGAWADETKAFENEGIDVHVVRDPPGKAAAAAIKPVAEVADERLTKVVKESTTRFIAAMSKRRGIGKRALRALDGAVLSGAEAVEAGLADRVGSFEDALQAAAASAADRRTTMKNSKALAALNLDENASDADIARVASEVDVGRRVLALTGAPAADEAVATVEAYKQSHEAAEHERAALRAEREKLDAAERVKLLTQLVTAGWETPATAWAKDEDGLPIPGTPAPEWQATPIGALRARAETLCAQPRRHGSNTPSNAAEPKPAGVAAKTITVDGYPVGLSQIELESCLEAAGDDDKHQQQTLLNYARHKLAQGNTAPIILES